MNEQEKYEWKVFVSCMTFNHAPYIVDAMNGFTMQDTSFPFVCSVVDDASTDGEQEVIKKYLNEHFDLEDKKVVRQEETDDYVLTFARHKTNLNCYFAVFFLKYNHYKKKDKGPYLARWRENAKYISVCEGDDYWIAEDKLQKQVDALDNNPHSTMVYTDYQTVDESGNTIIRPIYEKYKRLHMSGDNLPNLFKTNYPLTCTVMVKQDVLFSDLKINAPSTMDYALFMAAAFMGDFVYINKMTSSYRMNPDSLMNSNHNRLAELAKKIHEYYSYAYAQGVCKKESVINDIIIKYRISKRYVSHMPEHKPIFKKLCKYSKSFFLFVPIVWIVKIYEKISFQR